MVTIADVAKAAGVSASTVSYVMSGKRAISQETRDRVGRAIDELGYSPHAGARSLASKSTLVIGLQAPLRAGVDVHVVMEIVTGVVRRARARGYDTLLLASDDSHGLGHAAKGSKVDGLLIMDVETDDPRLDTLRALESPSVLIGLPGARGDLACVDFDFEAAGALAAERLVTLGHRRIAMLGASEEVVARHTSYADRVMRGFTDACERLGVTGTVHACPSSADAADTLDRVLAAAPDITGIFVHNEVALPYVVDRIADHPRCGVLALCPEDIARGIPALADSIDMPAEDLGAAAADLVCEMIAGTAKPSVRLLPPQLRGAPLEPAA